MLNETIPFEFEEFCCRPLQNNIQIQWIWKCSHTCTWCSNFLNKSFSYQSVDRTRDTADSGWNAQPVVGETAGLHEEDGPDSGEWPPGGGDKGRGVRPRGEGHTVAATARPLPRVSQAEGETDGAREGASQAHSISNALRGTVRVDSVSSPHISYTLRGTVKVDQEISQAYGISNALRGTVKVDSDSPHISYILRGTVKDLRPTISQMFSEVQ